MPKNKISEFSSTPANNTDIGGIDIAEGCAPSGINNAIRELMAQLKDQQAGTDSDSFTVGGALSVAGTSTLTGAVSAPAGVTGNLTGNASGTAANVTGVVAVANGGTGATSGNAAQANLQTFTTTATTSGGTTTLTNASTYYQYFTGSFSYTVVLPVTSTLSQGWSFYIVNNSSGTITVQSSGLNSIGTIPSGITAHVTCILTSGTTAASWDYGLTDFGSYTGTGAVVLSSTPVFSGTLNAANIQTTGNTTLGDATTDTLNVGAGGLVKDASGNVGVGTASPAYKLDVNGTINASGTITGNLTGNVTGNVSGSSGSCTGNSATATTATTATTAGNVSGTVAVANGGTGLATLTANNVILGNGTSTPSFVAPSTTGNVLTSNGTTWTSAAAFIWNVVTVNTTVASNATGSYTIPANSIMVTGTSFASMGSNSGSQISVRIKNSGGTILSTHILTGGNELNGGDAGSGMSSRSAWSVAIPSTAIGGTLEFFRSAGSNSTYSVTVNQVVKSA
jgi:hypothetical protein